MSGPAWFDAVTALLANLTVADARLARWDPNQPTSVGWLLFDGPEFDTSSEPIDGALVVGFDPGGDDSSGDFDWTAGAISPQRPRDEDGSISMLAVVSKGVDVAPAAARTDLKALLGIVDQATRGVSTSISGAGTVKWGLLRHGSVIQTYEGKALIASAVLSISYKATNV